jgi:hypothetical protein
MRKTQTAALLLALVVCPLVCAQTVKVNWNSTTQFSRYKTYSWKPAANPGNPLFGQWVQPDVDSKLAAAGLQFLYPGQSPDLYVIYSVRTVEKEDATTTMEGYGWGDGPWVGYGWNEGMAEGLPPVQTVTTDTPHTLGILTLDIVDRAKKAVIWRGQSTIEHISKNDKHDAEQVQKIVDKMFKSFPPVSTAQQ